ncbi:Uu.00g005110.m01.CDS01 [Anthostomella pinea]|uniref:Uu.00g005110.m01.CDS01 n=1 Tax=Anthostomella pinea TaxID=933095 RepID=A0AAI8VK30_9PEZI|nr:Uu.00g005110.m01.CDS01 [Anthostomella pinea]
MPPLRCANSPPAAKLFLQLCAGRSSVPPAASSILDVLLPAHTRTYHLAATRNPTTRTAAIPAQSSLRQDVARRSFSSTSAWRRTQAIYNPQQDEDGNEMLMEITPRAANRLSQIMTKDSNPHLALRVQVESGGCHGFQYLMSLTTLPPSTIPASASRSTTPPVPTNPAHPPNTSAPNPPSESTVASAVTPSTTASTKPSATEIGEDDTIFAFVADGKASDGGERGAEAEAAAGPKIVLDGPSLELLKGSKVDFTMELIGSQFKVVDNPLATSSCGCGTSFDIKA